MPTYQYACDPCKTIYEVIHGMNDSPPKSCPECKSALRRMLTAPHLNTKNHTSPTEAKYAKISESDEIAMEKELQSVYKTIWMPDEVKHDPWDEHH